MPVVAACPEAEKKEALTPSPFPADPIDTVKAQLQVQGALAPSARAGAGAVARQVRVGGGRWCG